VNAELKRVCITGTGSFLPNDPVPNERIDQVLGELTDAPDRVKKFLATVAARMLAHSGVEYRHLAVDPETHKLTHTVACLAEEACRRALEAARRKPADVELLLLSCPNYDESTPPTSTLLQERLGIDTCAEMEIHSNCSGVGKSMQVAYDALRLGRYRNALIVYAQLSSAYLRSSYFNQPLMNKSQATLRYILADGSGAVFLEAVDAGPDEAVPHELIGTYVESVGGKSKPGMTAGGGVGNLLDGSSVLGLHERGWHHLDQDFAAVNRDAGRLCFEGVVKSFDSLRPPPERLDHLVISIPSRQLYEDNVGRFLEHFHITREQMKFRAGKTGYCGGASILLHFDEMVRDDELRPGDIVVVHSVESSKWMTAGFVARW
jgi:3-oxoacyl-[acyl-carrier-protein] synthase-3